MYLFLYYDFLSPVASAPTNPLAVQEGLTSIRVSWTISGNANGYRIDYKSSNDDSHGSLSISDHSNSTVLLTDLIMEATYTISIVATSPHFHSTAVKTQVTLSKNLIAEG